MWHKRMLYLLAICPIIGVLWFIMTYGVSRYPYADTTITLADTAIQTWDNRLTPNDIFATHYRHRIVFSRLSTILLTEFNQWDVRYEVLLNGVLGIINCGLIALLLWRTWGKSAPLMLFATTFLMLNLDQAINWLSGLQNSWGFVTLFSLLAIHFSIGQHAISFIGAVVCAVCASLSLGNGMLIWGILVVVLWLNKNRHLWRYIILILGGGIFIFITLRGGLGITGNQYQPLQLGDMPDIIHIWLLMHSRPFLSDIRYQLIPDTPQTVYFAISQTTGFSILPALIGFGLFGYTAWCIFRRAGMQSLAIPIGIGLYASGALALIAFITPLQTMTEHSDKIVLALTERYLYVTVIFWLMLMSLIALYWRYAQRPYKTLVNLIMVIFIGSHLHTLMREIPYISFNELAFQLDDPLQNGHCAEMYIFTGDRTCIYASWMTDWDNLDQLASRRLAGYADLPTHTLIPYFSQDDMLILNSESAWQSMHLRDFFFVDTPRQAVIHIAPNTSETLLADITRSPNPPAYLLLGHDEQNSLSALVTDKSGVWYVIRPPLYQGEALPQYRTELETQFVPARHIITPENIQLTRYIRPFETFDSATFGDAIHLVGYQFVGDTDFEACDTIILQTAWMTKNTLNQTIQLSFALTDDPITRAITNTDLALSPIPVQFWDVDKAYYDERYLTLPCDLPRGNYLFTLTVYPISDEGDILPNLSANSTEMRVDGHLLVIKTVVIH